LGLRARGKRRQGGIVSLTLCVRPGYGGTIVAISGEDDAGTEAPLQLALPPIIRERGARLMLDVSGVSFMDCADLRTLRTDRHGRGIGRGAEHHGPFRQILNERTGCDAPAEVSARLPDLGERAIVWCCTQLRMTADLFGDAVTAWRAPADVRAEPSQRDHDDADVERGEHGPPNRALSGTTDKVMRVPLTKRRPVAPGQDWPKDAGSVPAALLDGNGNTEAVR
jgi:hypothetical protein